MFATLPTGFAEQAIATGLRSPTTMAVAPDGRLFVAEQGGALRVVRSGKLLARPFATFATETNGERGLIGVTFDKDFAKNRYVYVYRTVPASGSTPAHNRVSRLVSNGDVAVRGSERTVIDLSPLVATNHNGGAMRFGPDGKLYIATGDNATRANAQSLGNLHGKILRIFPDGRIPQDNPFSKAKGQNKAIWALGLRNPFNFDVDRASGRMFVNDVGQNDVEEVNEGVRGANYGWPVHEGPDGGDDRYRDPIFSYAHGVGPTTGQAIVGGAFYSPARRTFPSDYAGDYFFADLASGWIRRLDPTTRAVSAFASDVNVPIDVATAADGSLYYLERGTGSDTGRVMRVRTA